jgi:transposase
MPAQHVAKHPASAAPTPAGLPDVAALSGLSEQDIRALAARLIEQAGHSAQAFEAAQVSLRHSQAKIDALTHELRLLRHWKFAPKSEVLHADQRALFEQAREEDIAALEQEIEGINQAQQEPPAAPARVRVVPVRNPLPEHLARVDVRHEPQGFDGQSCPCGCGAPMVRIGEDVSEKLDYVPGSLRVERHVRGRWACRACERVLQEAMPAHVIDKGLPSEALLAQVAIAKYDDHLPLYRQSEMFARLGVQISRSTLCQWSGAVGQALLPLVAALQQEVLSCEVLHADESPIQVLCAQGQSQRGYIWAFSPAKGQGVQAVIYEINDGRSGKHARRFLGREHPSDRDKDQDKPTASRPPQHAPLRPPWSGHLMVDDYAGYKALFEAGVSVGAIGADGHTAPAPIIELGCWAHARRKFHELHIANQSPMAQEALVRIARLYAVESQIRDHRLSVQEAQALREQRSLPELTQLKAWMLAQRQNMTAGTASAKALDYSLKRWDALKRYAHSAHLPIDNNPIERLIRPWAIGRKNWLFAGSMKAAERAAAIMSLIESAKLNGLEPQAYLTDVLRRLPTQLDRDIHELLPTHWKPLGD